MNDRLRPAKAKSKLVLSLLAGTMSILPLAPAIGQTWNGSVDNNWFTAGNWSDGTVPNSSSAAAVIDVATNNPVMLNAGAAVSTLTLGGGDSLDQTAGVFVVDGGAISNAGAFALASQLQLASDVTLSGSGVLTLNGGAIGADSYNGRLLTNASTIDGSGLIGSNSGALYYTLSLDNTGTVDADTSGGTLTIGGNGGAMTNTGLLEATNGGVLDLAAATPLDNVGGSITASGSGVVTVDMAVQGGVLTTTNGGTIETGGSGAYLDGASNGAITLSDGSTYTAASSGGLTRADGTLDLGTGGSGATLALSGSLQLNGGDLTLAGPGVVTMSGNAQIGADSYGGRTLYNQATIQGSGLIGSNNGALYYTLSLDNAGTIDADVSGATLTIGGNGPALTNTGLLEATGGGVLDLAAIGAPLTNAGAAITASGAGSTVLVDMQVQGGTLTTSGGGVIQTGGSGAYLNGSTFNGAITISDGSTYTAGSNALTRAAGVLDIGTSSGATLALSGSLQVAGADLTLAGPGALIMSGGAQIGADSYNGRTLKNEATIEGSGLIGSNNGALYYTLALDNSGVIDANVSGATLTIAGNGGPMVNSNLLEATGGGTLDLAAGMPLDDAGGRIIASGSGSTVLVDTDVQGGTLTTTGGGVIQTGNSGAFLDGAANGPVTVSDGSTYTAGSNALTRAVGALDLGAGATLALAGQLQLNGGDLTLSGPGALAISGGEIGADNYGGRTLNNGATIEGYGLIGSNNGALYYPVTTVNEAGGLLLANVAGQTLTVGGAALTNEGIVQADAGASLHVTAPSFTNFSDGALTGGTYNMYSGNVQINALGATGGEIATNQANILLDGAAATLTDASGLNALSNLSTNGSGASLTVENGNAFATAAPSTFTNNGEVRVGTGSSFTTLADYSQGGAGSSTVVDGTLTPGSATFALAGGVLSGSGEVAAAVTNTGGVVNPGDGIGTLRALSYTQGSGGLLDIEIAGPSSNDVLDVLGLATLGGELDPVLRSGFTPTLGESFTFLDYTSRSGEFSGIENDVFDGGRYMWGVTYNPTDAVLTVEQGPVTVSAAPEPSAWTLMMMGVGGLGLALRRSRRRPFARLKAVSAA